MNLQEELQIDKEIVARPLPARRSKRLSPRCGVSQRNEPQQRGLQRQLLVVVSLSYSSSARNLYFDSDIAYAIKTNRNNGQSVRPVIGNFLDVSPISLSFSCEASSAVFNVFTDQDCTISVSDSWITATASADKKTVKVTASANIEAARTGTITISGGGLTRTVTVAQAKYVDTTFGLCPDNNHPHVIDLGLDVKWACCNVGASSPIEYGGYYAWGETEEKTTYRWNTYKWCNGSWDTMTKYCTYSSRGTVDNKTQLDPSDDAARVKWGAFWRMPTILECQALLNCTSEYITINGVKGSKFTGPNGASIFLPAAGNHLGGELDNAGLYGIYWSSTLTESDPGNAYFLYFYSGNANWSYDGYRFRGKSVRPVR